MKVPRVVVLLVAMVVFSAIQQSLAADNQDCFGKQIRIGRFVDLGPRPSAPFFYYRMQDYVMVAQADVVKSEMDRWPTRPAESPWAKLHAWILSALPLQAETDLYTL